MAEQTIILTDYDTTRLEALINGRKVTMFRDKNHLLELEYELSRAAVVDAQDVPSNIVTMNSKVLLRDISNNKEMIVTLAFPLDASIEEGKISVLTPIGTAILGYAEGATIEWPVPGGVKNIKIEKILYQPEASGDYHL